MLLRLGQPRATWALSAPAACIRRLQSTWIHHPASPSAPREVPTPLILLSASRWSKEGKSGETLNAFAKHFSARGWSVSCLDLDPDELPKDDSQNILAALEAEFSAQLRKLNASPFPPLLIAKSLSTLIAESYVSSNALSGLVLLDPPIDPESACTSEEAGSEARLPTILPPFTYEVTFPCLVAWSQARAKELAFWDAHRVEHLLEDEVDAALDRRVLDLDNEGEEHDAGPYEVRKWAEDCGMVSPSRSEIGVTPPEERQGDREMSTDSFEPVGQSATKELPAWYIEGKYTRNPSRSKKEPLLLDESHISESFVRGSGPGGQAINKLSTCVQLKHAPTGIVLRCQDTRSRELNRQHARRKLSRELERLVFGELDSVLGQEALKERRKKSAKQRKRKRKIAGQEEEESSSKS